MMDSRRRGLQGMKERHYHPYPRPSSRTTYTANTPTTATVGKNDPLSESLGFVPTD